MRRIDKQGKAMAKLVNILAISFVWLMVVLPVFVTSQIKTNEETVISKIQKLTEACEKFKLLNKIYPKDLQSLFAFLHEEMTSPGYTFTYNRPGLEEYMLLASPNLSGVTGQSGFYADNNNEVIKVKKDLVPSIADSLAQKDKAVLPVTESATNYSQEQNRQDMFLISETAPGSLFDDSTEELFGNLVANLEATTSAASINNPAALKYNYSLSGANSVVSYINSGSVNGPGNGSGLKGKQSPDFPVVLPEPIPQGKGNSNNY